MLENSSVSVKILHDFMHVDFSLEVASWMRFAEGDVYVALDFFLKMPFWWLPKQCLNDLILFCSTIRNLAVYKVCDGLINRELVGSCQCKSLPAFHPAPAGLMLRHIGKWGRRVDKDFNRILKWVMVAFMCVIVTYPKVMASKRHHPSPACLPQAPFCLTDSLKLCLFACAQSHFHLWWSWVGAIFACSATKHQNGLKGAGSWR